MENLKRALEITKVSRKAFRNILDNYTLKQLNKVPDGFKNNLFWNIAHVVVTQQLLCYRLSGLDTLVDEEWIELKELLFSTIEKIEEDIEAGLFNEFKEYPTSTGFVLKSVGDAFEFNNFHDGIHLGYVLALKKVVK